MERCGLYQLCYWTKLTADRTCSAKKGKGTTVSLSGELNVPFPKYALGRTIILEYDCTRAFDFPLPRE